MTFSAPPGRRRPLDISAGLRRPGRRRVNLLTFPSDFANAAWGLQNITAGPVVDGWSAFRETTAATYHRLNRTAGVAIVADRIYTWAYDIHKAGRQHLGIRLDKGSGLFHNAGFDLDARTVTFLEAGLLSAAVVPRGGDVYRLSASFLAAGTVTVAGLITAPAAISNNLLPQFGGNTEFGFDVYQAELFAGQ